MNFLRSLIEAQETVYKFRVEIFDLDGEKVDEVEVMASSEKDAEAEGVYQSRHPDADSGLAVDKEDVE